MASLLASLVTALHDHPRMNDEDNAALEPVIAALVPVTKEAKRALGDKTGIRITHFPFRIGRESRRSNPPQSPVLEQRTGVVPPNNDVYLIEPTWSDVLYISREHFSIEREGRRCFVLDRGSACGTVVAGRHIGGNREGGRCELRNGDLIIVGSSSSDYVFRFEVS